MFSAPSGGHLGNPIQGLGNSQGLGGRLSQGHRRGGAWGSIRVVTIFHYKTEGGLLKGPLEKSSLGVGGGGRAVTQSVLEWRFPGRKGKVKKGLSASRATSEPRSCFPGLIALLSVENNSGDTEPPLRSEPTLTRRDTSDTRQDRTPQAKRQSHKELTEGIPEG